MTVIFNHFIYQILLVFPKENKLRKCEKRNSLNTGGDSRFLVIHVKGTVVIK